MFLIQFAHKWFTDGSFCNKQMSDIKLKICNTGTKELLICLRIYTQTEKNKFQRILKRLVLLTFDEYLNDDTKLI